MKVSEMNIITEVDSIALDRAIGLNDPIYTDVVPRLHDHQTFQYMICTLCCVPVIIITINSFRME